MMDGFRKLGEQMAGGNTAAQQSVYEGRLTERARLDTLMADAHLKQARNIRLANSAGDFEALGMDPRRAGAMQNFEIAGIDPRRGVGASSEINAESRRGQLWDMAYPQDGRPGAGIGALNPGLAIMSGRPATVAQQSGGYLLNPLVEGGGGVQELGTASAQINQRNASANASHAQARAADARAAATRRGGTASGRPPTIAQQEAAAFTEARARIEAGEPAVTVAAEYSARGMPAVSRRLWNPNEPANTSRGANLIHRTRTKVFEERMGLWSLQNPDAEPEEYAAEEGRLARAFGLLDEAMPAGRDTQARAVPTAGVLPGLGDATGQTPAASSFYDVPPMGDASSVPAPAAAPAGAPQGLPAPEARAQAMVAAIPRPQSPAQWQALERQLQEAIRAAENDPTVDVEAIILAAEQLGFSFGDQ